jgi:CheY-like chemotaxis protein
VLVVDDDVDAAEAMKTVLEGEGYQVTVAHSPVEAWEKVSAQRPHLILLDIMMPAGTEGFHFVWKLRGADEEQVRDIPIIVVSAIHEGTPMRFYPAESDGTYAPGEYLPVQAFLDKPVESRKLLAQVAGILHRRPAAS